MDQSLRDRSEIEQARKWILENKARIDAEMYPNKPVEECKMYEDWAEVYEQTYPGEGYGFMCAWFDEFGGI